MRFLFPIESTFLYVVATSSVEPQFEVDVIAIREVHEIRERVHKAALVILESHLLGGCIPP